MRWCRILCRVVLNTQCASVLPRSWYLSIPTLQSDVSMQGSVYRCLIYTGLWRTVIRNWGQVGILVLPSSFKNAKTLTCPIWLRPDIPANICIIFGSLVPNRTALFVRCTHAQSLEAQRSQAITQDIKVTPTSSFNYFIPGPYSSAAKVFPNHFNQQETISDS